MKEILPFSIFSHIFSPHNAKPKERSTSMQTVPTERISSDTDISRVSASALACATQNKKPKAQVNNELRKILKQCYIYPPDDFYEKFDYENAQEHINHLKFLACNHISGAWQIFGNGYFYSKEGLEAFNLLTDYFSIQGNGSIMSPFECMANSYTPEKVIKGKERNLYKTQITNVKSNEYHKVTSIINLSDEEYSRLIKSHLLEKGILYASENKDINNLFIHLISNQNAKTKWNPYGFKILDKLILEQTNSKDEIKELTKNITNLKNNSLLYSCITEDRKNSDVDLKFLVNNVEDIYSLIHSHIPEYKDISFGNSFSSLMLKLNKDNINTFKNLVVLKGMNQHLMEQVLTFLYSKENSEYVDNVIKRINSGEDDIISLPVYKYAQINERIAKTKQNELTEYNENTSLSEISKTTKQGDICAVGNKVYIKDEEELTQLDIDKNTYKRLFPEYKSLCIRQGDETGNCYFLSAGLISFWKNPKARVQLLKMFKQDGNDIVVTIPAFKQYPVRFNNGKITLENKHADTSTGNLMLEQAYAKAKYANANHIKHDASLVNSDVAMEYIYGGFGSHVFNELTRTKNAMEYINKEYDDIKDKPDKYIYVDKEKMENIIDSHSDLNKYMVCLSSGPRERGYLPDYGINQNHAYAIENIDTKNKTVTIINPYNSLYTSTISYDQLKEYFSTISVIEVN